jgi:hypothetical protein
LPNISDIFGVTYEEALDNLLKWVKHAAIESANSNLGVRFCCMDSDTLMFEASTADLIFSAMRDLVKRTTRVMREIDNKQLLSFGLLPVGIAWCESNLGQDFNSVKAGISAFTIGNLPGIPPGTINMTEAVYQRLLPENQKLCQGKNDVPSGQGILFQCYFDINELKS